MRVRESYVITLKSYELSKYERRKEKMWLRWMSEENGEGVGGII